MTKKRKEILLPFFSVILLCVALLYSSDKKVYADDTLPEQTVNATIKIAVCGDTVVEDPEECEGEDLDGQTCESLGYGSGVLTCDSSCSFDESQCIPKPVSPSGDDDEDDGDDDGDDGSEDDVSQEIMKIIQEILDQMNIQLPGFVQKYDLDSSGKIEAEELYNTVKKWVLSWRDNSKTQDIEKSMQNLGQTTCDLNNDEKCNLVDFSVLLYYVNR